MNANSKFLFDTEFGAASVPLKKKDKEPPTPPLVYSEEHKVAFCDEARQAGFAEGQAQAMEGIEASLTQILDSMNAQLQQLTQIHDSQLGNLKCEAASMAFAIAGKLAPALIARQPEAEVLKMVEECLADLHDEPRIVVRASEPVCSALSEKIDRLTQSTGFQGNVILLPDDTKTDGDCRIEWADGGVDRELEDTHKKVNDIVDRFIRSSGSGTETHQDLDPV